ncbi:MAG: pantetheine-phosphate adenylyltransferase [Bacteroidales bacterium]|nr:pantetheine-phosphate adenylyltransferase [Bacteroidales bacterium]
MTRIAVFPGSFDPITIGHVSIINRAVSLFDELVIAIGLNAEKKSFFPVEARLKWIENTFKSNPKIKVVQYEGLTVDLCKKLNSKYILRGLRTSADFEFERSIGQVNKKLFPDIETIFFLSLPEHNSLNSSIVRDVVRHGGDARSFVPKEVDLTVSRI